MPDSDTALPWSADLGSLRIGPFSAKPVSIVRREYGSSDLDCLEWLVCQTFEWNEYPLHRISPDHPAEMHHADVVRLLEQIRDGSATPMTLTERGRSVENRAILLASLGRGPRRILLWSQMHGDEPTHTAVLLDVLNFLTRQPGHPTARAILEHCTLFLLPMLNPDGAECFSRRNAQDLDINRDARILQTPEGRILHDAAAQLRPQFAFNLHDQNERTSVGHTRQPAAISLLVPPLGVAWQDTENTIRAKKIAACFHQAVAARAPGMVSRYEAEYMPHAFGEAMQQAGAVTVLIEAGGWHGHDPQELVQLHFFGLIHCLLAIATDAYEQSDPASYDALLRCGDAPLFDLVIAGVAVENGHGHRTFTTDIGIHGPTRKARCNGRPLPGIIDDLGDLHVSGRRETLAGLGLTCAPGRIVFHPQTTPRCLPADGQIHDWIRGGITTVIGVADLHDSEQSQLMMGLFSNGSPRINLGFVGASGNSERADELHAGWSHAAARRLLAVWGPDGGDRAARRAGPWGLPVLPEESWASEEDHRADARRFANLNRRRASRLGLADRGFVGRGAVADLMLVRSDDGVAARPFPQPETIQHVILNGRVVYSRGTFVDECRGLLLNRSVH